MKRLIWVWVVVCAASLAGAQAADGEFGAEDAWQQHRLFEPTAADLNRERRGMVLIYDGFADREVNRAMDAHFERIQAMMFVNTVITDESEKPVKDPETGDLLTEDDDCE